MLFFLLLFCRKQATDVEPIVEIPFIIPTPADTAVVERGLDAVPELDAIQIEWQRSSQYQGCKIYRRCEDEDEFRVVARMGVNDSLFLDSNEIFTNKRYYYYLRAHDGQQNWSEPSDTVHYKLLPKAINLSIIAGDSLQFNWQVQEITPGYYVIKLFDNQTAEDIWISLVPSGYAGMEESALFNSDGRAKIQKLIPGRRYRWRIDIVGATLFSGSESRWHKFVAS